MRLKGVLVKFEKYWTLSIHLILISDSPTDFPINNKKLGFSATYGTRKTQAEIANMTIIVDDNDASKMLSDGCDSDEASRRCSIGSASSLQSDHHHLGLGDLVKDNS